MQNQRRVDQSFYAKNKSNVAKENKLKRKKTELDFLRSKCGK